MNLIAVPSLPPEQITAEVAEMRKATQEILGSRKKRLEFLRQVGVLAGKNKHGPSRKNSRPAFRK